MAKAFEGIEKGLPRPDDEPGQQRVLDAPWTWLFLVRLRPRRARLRFTRRIDYNTKLTKMSVFGQFSETRG
jgi:hypothetical protein